MRKAAGEGQMSATSTENPSNFRFGHLDHPKLRHRYGRVLTWAAWGIEIIAAAIGLFIALATIFVTHDEILKEQSFVDARAWLNIFISGLPFFMVAIVELMKIPLATAFYLAQSRIWRWIFLTALLLLIAVTFETMINGFQRQFESRIYNITKDRTDLINIEEKVARVDDRISELESITVEKVTADHENELVAITEDRESALDDIGNLRREELEKAELTGTTAQETEVTRIQNQIVLLRSQQADEIQALSSTYEADTNRNTEDIGRQRTTLTQRLASLDQQLLQLNEAYQSARANCILFGCAGVDTRFKNQMDPVRSERILVTRQLESLASSGGGQQLRGELDQRVSNIRARYTEKLANLENRASELAREIDNRRSRSTAKIRPKIDQLDNRRTEIIENAKLRRTEVDARFDLRILEAQERENSISGLQSEKAGFEEERGELRNDINLKAKDNQIFQLAALWFGHESPVDVSKDELKFVSIIWFGSLAAIVALMGTILAFAGLVVRYHDPDPNKTHKRSLVASLARSCRAFFIDSRRYYRKKYREGPRVVTKEVPVDKVVFKEVPREVIHKELVYVPIYTNDPELLPVWDGVEPFNRAAKDPDKQKLELGETTADD
jgi:hypothetical protein